MSSGSLTMERPVRRFGSNRPPSGSRVQPTGQRWEPGQVSYLRRGRRRSTATALVTVIALALALVTGLVTGGGRDALSRIAGLGDERGGGRVVYGTAEVPGHPGAGARVERRDLIRQFVALDGVN